MKVHGYAAGFGALVLVLSSCGARSSLEGEPAEETTTEPPRAAVLLSAGSTHACVRDPDGRLFCWGDVEAAVRGLPGSAPTAPNELTGVPTLTALSAGTDTTCGVSEDGRVVCWGLRARSFVRARDAMNPSATPVVVEGVTGARDVAVGPFTICAALRDGSARCWGENIEGRLGQGDFSERDGVQRPIGITDATAVMAGYESIGSVGASGAISVWGAWLFPEPRGRMSVVTPVTLQDFSGMRSASMGLGFTCAVSRSDEVWCAGYNGLGELGDGTKTSRPEAARVAGLPPVRVASAGFSHACALGTDASVWCWGDSRNGEAGILAGEMAIAPRRVSLPIVPVALAAGWGFTCAASADTQVYCWGSIAAGLGGEATDATKHIPRAVFAR